jgi:hypothetical protein
MMFTIEWSQHQQKAASIQDVERILDKLHADFAREDPQLVTVELNETGESLAIGLGRDRSVLNYMSGNKNPPYFTSIGELEADASIEFQFGGEWSEFPIRSSVPVSIARQAMRHFCATGKLSTAVQWEQD